MGARTDRPTPDLTESTLVRHPNGYYVDTATGMVLSRLGFIGTNGYERLELGGYAHRVVWEAMHGPIPEGLSINHLDGEHGNNHPANLELATQSRQIRHAWEIGKRVHNGLYGRFRGSRLTDEQLDAIKAAPRGTITALSAELGISRTWAYQIRSGVRGPGISRQPEGARSTRRLRGRL